MAEKIQSETCCTLHYLINIASKQVVLDPMNHLLSQNGCLCDTNELFFLSTCHLLVKNTDLICLSVDPKTLTAKYSECYSHTSCLEFTGDGLICMCSCQILGEKEM